MSHTFEVAGTESLAQRLVRIISEVEAPKGVEFVNMDILYNTWDELFASDLYKDMWSGWQGMGADMSVSRRSKLIIAFATYVPSSTNYGVPYKLFAVYEVEGLRCIRQLQIHSSLTSAPIRRASLYPDSVLFTNTYYRKDNEARKILREMCAKDSFLVLS